ncbi:MAG: hypothetical protein M3R70_12285 [Actinomycetota bacterium]|nr:hypothetical protein [Actinomycetota bacterium]
MATNTDDRLDAGREAYDRHDWPQAFELLREADGSGQLAAADLERLGEAAWWTGAVEDAIGANERAFAAHIAAGDNLAAVPIALRLGRDYEHRRSPVADAWLKRAERLTENEADCAAHGYVERTKARRALAAGELDAAFSHAEQALELGMRHGDRNLQALALHDQGRILISKGEADKGLALLDEATVAAVSGELGPFPTAIIYCGIISACRDLADWGRAGEWTEAAKRWCARQSISGFPGICRVNRAEVMRLRGAWAEAATEAERACQELEGFAPDVAAEAFYELGEIRLRMGDLPSASDAFRQAHGLGRDPQPGLALLRLAEGNADRAFASIERALTTAHRDRLTRARVLPAAVEIGLAVGRTDFAGPVAAELEEIADSYRTPALLAAASLAAGAMQHAAGAHDEAIPALRRAIDLWHEVELPYEAAKARLVLASAYRSRGDADAAVLELEAAKGTFERLGALPDVRRAADELVAVSPAADVPVQTTFMFTDICGSTNLVEAIGDEAWQHLVSWHDRTLRSLFTTHDGEEVDHAGDGFFVAFAEPTAAVKCAVAVQRALAEHRQAEGFAPQVRIGIHATEAGRAGSNYRGKGVHEAARIGALAQGGEILASVQTVDGTLTDASEPRAVTLKGISEPVSVVSVGWR